MNKVIIAFIAILLSGCGYDYSEIQAAKSACASYQGKFQLVVTGSVVTSTKCTVDGVKYRIGRTSYGLLEGVVE